MIKDVVKQAIDAVLASQVGDAVKTGMLYYDDATAQTYDAEQGIYVTQRVELGECRLVFDDQKNVSDKFPDYVLGKTDKMVFCEYDGQILENYILSVDGVTYTVKKASNMLEVSAAHYLVIA